MVDYNLFVPSVRGSETLSYEGILNSIESENKVGKGFGLEFLQQCERDRALGAAKGQKQVAQLKELDQSQLKKIDIWIKQDVDRREVELLGQLLSANEGAEKLKKGAETSSLIKKICPFLE